MKENIDNLRLLYEFAEVIRKEVDDEMPVHRLHIFLYIANNEGTSLVDIENALGIRYGTVSTNCKKLGKYIERRKGKDILKGHDLIEARPDLYEPKRKNFSLTQKGRHLIKTLNRIQL